MGHRLALLVTGASGMRLPQRLLCLVAAHPQVERLHLVVSRAAELVLGHELGGGPAKAISLLDRCGLAPGPLSKVVLHRNDELDAAISSGSYRLQGAVILPCSSSTLGALATGTTTSLIHRAGAVALKERWPLVLGFRETPLSAIHLENLRRLAYWGATVLPPIPAFYIGGEDMDRFLAAYCQRVLDRLGIPWEADPGLRWGEES
jgi:4-hydroxy-3-polyprenylbenzoate decarboxylase